MENCLSGFNTCLFAYGQTGSGKTFTMMGSEPSPTVSVPSPPTAGPPSTPTTTTALPATMMPPPRPVDVIPRQRSPVFSGGDTLGRRSSFGWAHGGSSGDRNGVGSSSGGGGAGGVGGVVAAESSHKEAATTAATAAAAPATPPSSTSTEGRDNTTTACDLLSEGSPRGETDPKGPPAGVDRDAPVRGVEGDKGGGEQHASRGVIPRICYFLFERAAGVTAEANNGGRGGGGTKAVVADLGALGGGGAVNGRSGGGGVEGGGKRQSMNTRWSFRCERSGRD